VIYFANPSTDDIRDQIAAGALGCITTPKQGNVTFPGEWDVIADNGCFSSKWDHKSWIDWLVDLPRTVRFAVCPDVFFPSGAPCHEQTLERWERYGGMIERAGFTPAFVLQNGATPDNLPDAPVLFIGGDDAYKLGPVVWDIAQRYAGERWIHMGRVNSLRRFRTARTLGCRSADGTFLTFGPDKNLPRLLAMLDDQDREPMLWEAS
jgi:hypothetical protein